jgi:hypothetical protein
MAARGPMLRAFSMLELQIAIVLLTMTLLTLSGLSVMQARLASRLEDPFRDGATLYINHCSHDWYRALNLPAILSEAPPNCPLMTPPLLSLNDVTLLDTQIDLRDSAMGATVKVKSKPPGLIGGGGLLGGGL